MLTCCAVDSSLGEGEADFSSVQDGWSPRMRRFKFREKKRARSTTDLSHNHKRRSSSRGCRGGGDGAAADDDDDDDDERSGGGMISRTEPSSPAKRSLGLKSANKRMQAVWSSLKKFAPHKLRARNKDEIVSKRNTLHGGVSVAGGDRLSASHPDVSCSDLAALAGNASLRMGGVGGGGCLDDASFLLRNGGGEEPADFSQVPSVSFPILNRQMSLAERRIHFESEQSSQEGPGGAGGESSTAFKQNDHLGTDLDMLDYPGGSVEHILSRQKLRTFRQYAFFQLDVHLRCGKDMLAKDSCGTSDPYVKFKSGGKHLYKSKTIHKTLEPVWDEFFVLPIEDVFQPITLKVYDYDFGLQDDFMGAATLDLTRLDMHRATDTVLSLTETGNLNDNKLETSWGKIMLTLTLIPKSQEDKEQYFTKSSCKTSESSAAGMKKAKTQIWDSVVTIVLVEGKALLPMDENGLSDPYVKFRLGTEKYKSKNAMKTLFPQWLEQFDLHMYPDQPRVLEMAVWDKDFHGKDDFMGRCNIDLSHLEKEKTHRLWQDLEDGAGAIFLLLTISGTLGTETISDLIGSELNPKQREAVVSRYGLLRSFTKVNDIGHLVVKVFKAFGVAAADIGGKSDPFCVVELVNARLQTNTEYKTLSPEWNKIFTFQVKDIHSAIEVTVYDEDQNKKFEFLGKVSIPLLRVKNGERKWYALKDKKLRGRAKGQILLEMDFVYNPIRASIRTLNPKEMKYMQQDQKFKRAVFMRNVSRVKLMALDFIEIARFLNNCFLWESPARSVIAFIVFLIVTYTFELYMLPITFLLIFLKNYIVLAVTGIGSNYKEEEEIEEDDEDDDDDKDGKGEEKKSLKEKLQAVQEVTAMVQNVLGEIASFGERCKNTFNFTVPFLSWLAIIVLSVVTFFLYLVPLRYIIMLWGINKFTRKLRCPHAVPNNELLDFLSRVPDSDEKIDCRELKVSLPPSVVESDKRKKKKTS